MFTPVTDKCIFILDDLVHLLQNGCQIIGRKNPLNAAKEASGHGVIESLQLCLSVYDDWGWSFGGQLRVVVKNLLTTCDKIIQRALSLLGGAVHEDAGNCWKKIDACNSLIQFPLISVS